jgi:hypothetical protein
VKGLLVNSEESLLRILDLDEGLPEDDECRGSGAFGMIMKGWSSLLFLGRSREDPCEPLWLEEL